jgi:rhodanese-related sulfurtransferase
VTATSIDDLLAQARSRIDRVDPDAFESLRADGALVVDIRPAAQRAAEGELGFGLVVERNVLEWRFDLTGSHTLPDVSSYDQAVVVVCSEGYASSLAADSLRQLGFTKAADLTGGYRAWRRWRDGVTPPAAPGHLTA